MPGWAIHTIIANKLSEKINIDKNSFIFGNIVPDINNGYVVDNIGEIISHMDTHFTKEEDIKEIKFNFNNIKRFRDEYKNNMNNPIVLGYFTHLLTDSFWNEMVYNEHYLYNENKDFFGIRLYNKSIIECDKKTATSMKQKEFKEFGAKLLNESINIIFPIYSEELAKCADTIKEINITDEDVKKIIKHLNEVTKNQEIDENFEYKVFSEKELYEKYENTIDYCLENIKEFCSLIDISNTNI